MDPSSVRSGLLAVEEVVRSVEFDRWREAFVRKNVSHFEYGEENKLEYTDIHREYEEGVERKIVEGLPKDFDMAAFQRALPGYLESGMGLKDEQTGRAVTTLLEVGDFTQFREMMMFEKKKREEAAAKADAKGDDDMHGLSADSAQLTDVGLGVAEMMDMCAALSEASDSTSKDWVNVLSNDWMKIDKMAVPEGKRRKKSDIYLKGVWTMNLSFTEACDMMFTFTPRRKNWDPNFTSVTLPCGGSLLDDDVVTSVALDFGFLVNLAMFSDSKGTQLIARNIRKWDVPTVGAVTYAMYPWSVKEGRLDTEHKLLSLKTGTIAPHPTNPNKIVMTTLEVNGMGGMPTW